METDQRAYWDRAALSKDFTTPFQMDVFKLFVEKTSRILDVGCGYGRTLNELEKERFDHLSGIDFSEKMIQRGKEMSPHLALQTCDKEFPFKDNSFDAVVLVAVLTCVVTDEAQARLVREIERVLVPGGCLYINDFLINQDERNLERYARFEARYGTYGVFELDEGALLRHHEEDHISQLVRHFRTEVFKPVVYTTMNRNRSNGFYYLGRLENG